MGLTRSICSSTSLDPRDFLKEKETRGRERKREQRDGEGEEGMGGSCKLFYIIFYEFSFGGSRFVESKGGRR